MDSYKDGSNWYNYCAGDPVNYIDPSGHFIISMAVGIGIAALVGATFAGLSIYEGFLFQEYTGRSTLGIIAGGLATGAAAGISTFFFLQTATAFLVNYVNYSAMAAGLAPVVTCAGGAGAAAGASAMAGLALYGQSGSLALPASAGQLMLPAGSMPLLLSEGLTQFSSDLYAGVKQASKYLQGKNVPRKIRMEVLESFDVGTIQMQKAGRNRYGMRFYGGNARAEGRYLFESFTNSTNRNNLSLPYEWGNSMASIAQFRVRENAMMITGRVAAQSNYGNQYIGGAIQWFLSDLEDLIRCQ